MHKASKEMRQIVPQVDLIIEVIDARIPFSSQNPMLAEIRGDKPCIKVLSKSDLADPILTKQWQDYFERENNVKTIALSTQQPEKMRDLLDLCHKMVPIQDSASGANRVQAMIMGIPNVGKSSLINILAGKMIAKTGNEPAVTKMQQRIKLEQGIVLLDTPGVLWPKLENRHGGYRLAITGAIKETAVSNDDIAMYAVDYFRVHYPALLRARYQLDQLPIDEMSLLGMIGMKRGCLRAGGIVDLERAAKILLTEFRDATLGLISLETPEMVEKELIEMLAIREEKAAKKAARKQKKHSSRN
ncbi:MAG: ribosome biogenesis GTPase YlqF [Pseudomonadota bacterium]|nr:ribosome biogenesis GTPase YlqF [Pseudomonadota bacterium]MDO7710840.1 ribosome biogenesis GTPase YlqF [Pseudomonadota bacterium]